MSINQILGISKAEGVRRIEMGIERVVVLTLIFTNTYFIFLFFAKLLQ